MFGEGGRAPVVLGYCYCRGGGGGGGRRCIGGDVFSCEGEDGTNIGEGDGRKGGEGVERD